MIAIYLRCPACGAVRLLPAPSPPLPPSHLLARRPVRNSPAPHPALVEVLAAIARGPPRSGRPVVDRISHVRQRGTVMTKSTAPVATSPLDESIPPAMSPPLGALPTLTVHLVIFDNTAPREAHATCTVSPSGIVCDRYAGDGKVLVHAEIDQSVVGLLSALLDAVSQNGARQ